MSEIPEAEINEQGLVECPVCRYQQEADPGRIICEYCSHTFKAIAANKSDV